MFTDEEMEIAYMKNKEVIDAFNVLRKSIDPHGGINALKKANNIWKLFASRHPEINKNAFVDVVCKLLPEKEKAIRNMLK